jgi:hypothetical protein
VEKKWAVALAILMLVILVGALFFASNTVIVINGQEVGGPLKGILAAGGLALVWLFVAVARKDEPGRRPAP